MMPPIISTAWSKCTSIATACRFSLAIALPSAAIALLAGVVLLAAPTGARAEAATLPEDFVEAMKVPADSITTLYSLDPGKNTDRSLYQEWTDTEPPKFHEFNVLGKVDLKAPAASAAFREVEKVTQESLGPKIESCFYPRHGIRIQTCDNRYDFVICYQCAKYALYRNGALVGYYKMKGPPDVMNEMVTTNGLTLAK